MTNDLFHRSIHGRGLTHAALAAKIGVTRSVLTRVLLSRPGVRGRGKETRPKLFLHLTPREITLLEWDEEYTPWLAEQRRLGTKLELPADQVQTGWLILAGLEPPMEQSSTENIVPSVQTL